MKKLYKLFFPVIALLCLMAPHSASASHVMGSDITWKCLGGDTFEVTVTAYRDCNGIPLSGTNLNVTTSEGCAGQIVTIAGAKTCCGKDITPVCQRSCTRCSDASCEFQFGIQQWTVTAKYVLPPPCCNYKFNWEECCRNGAITTLSPGDFYSEVTCNRCIKNPCDNSPYFTNPPVGIFCVDQCVVYNPGANDDDRDVNGNADSLVFSFGDPLSGPGSPYSYNSPYTSKTPLIYSGSDPDAAFSPPLCLGFHVDPQTGDIEFKATKTDVTVFCIVVDEYRKDSLGIERKIGTVRRDLQISIIDCPANHTPIVTGVNGGTSNSIKICADQQTCFTIHAFDIDPPDTVIMNWNNQIPGATFTVKKDGKKWPTGTFCWRPGKKDVRSYPYQFIITALDNHCPIPGRASRAFSVYVIASPDATHFTTVQKCGLVYFQADVAASSTTSISDYLFVGEGSPGYGPLFIHKKSGTYQYTRPGTYHYTLTVTGPNGCTQSYTDSVKIAQYAEIYLPKDTVVCSKSSPFTITATTGHASKPYVISWDYASSNHNDNITMQVTRDTVVVARIKDATGCTNYDSMKIRMQPLPLPNIGPNKRGCWGHPVDLTTGLKKKMPYVSWTKIQGKDTIRNFLSGDTISVNDSGKYVVSVRDSFGCNGYDTVDVFYNPLVRVTPLDTDACVNDSVRMTAGIAGPDATFKWIDIIHLNTVSTNRTYAIKALNTTNGHRFLVVINQTRNGVTCIDSGYKTIRVHKLPKPILSTIDDHCIDDLPFPLDKFVDKPHLGGTWYYAKNPSAIVVNYLYPSIIGSGSFYIHYRYADPFRCSSDDSDLVNITDKPNVSAGPDTEICTKNGRYDLTAHVNRKGGTWTPMAGTPKAALEYSAQLDTVWFNPAKVTLDTVYSYIYKWTNLVTKAKCSNADTINIRVRTNPAVTLVKIDTLCENDQPWQLSANPGGGFWALTDNTNKAALTYEPSSDSYIFDPSIAGGGVHKLSYTAYGDPWHKMCPTTDSTQAVVAAKPTPDFATEDKSWEYCVDHGIVKLVPNGVYPASGFSGRGTFMTGNQGYYDPSKGDTGSSSNNTITYAVPYNNNKCHVYVNHDVTIDYKPVVAIDPAGKSQCEGVDSFNFSADIYNCTDFSWDAGADGNTIIKKPIVGNKVSIVYHPSTIQKQQLQFNITLKGWNKGKCDTSFSMIPVKINPSPVPSYLADDTIGCEPLTVKFTSKYKMSDGSNVAPLRYDWDFADGSSSQDKDPTHIFNAPPGQVQHVFPVKFKVTVNTGCSGTVTNNITVNGTPRPKIYADPQFTTIAMPDVQFDLDTNRSVGVRFKDPTTTYYWSFGDGSNDHPTIKMPKHTYNDTGTFWVKLYVTSLGCMGVDSVQIVVKPELIIFIPNVFTPNTKFGDGKIRKPNVRGLKTNQTFQPEISAYTTFEMNVYNRWGELMFTSTDPAKGWDGWFKGQPPVMDAYVYVIKATSYSGKPYTFTGTITILL